MSMREASAGPSLTTAGASCAIATVIAFVAGFVFMAASGVQVLIPETRTRSIGSGTWMRPEESFS